MIDLTAIGRRVFALRKARGWNQYELAERAGIRQNMVSRVEAGEDLPSLPTAVKLALAFGVTIDALLTAPEEAERVA